jgi:hypothetical protein
MRRRAAAMINIVNAVKRVIKMILASVCWMLFWPPHSGRHEATPIPAGTVAHRRAEPGAS